MYDRDRNNNEKIIDRLESLIDVCNNALIERLETIIRLLIDIKENQDYAYRIAGVTKDETGK